MTQNISASSSVDRTAAAKMWRMGKSAGAIASFFNVSHNVIMGLTNRHREEFPFRNRVTHGRAAETLSEYAVEPAKHEPIKPPDPIARTEYDNARISTAKELYELRKGECNWPLNAGGPFLFCAASTHKNGSYCRHHRNRAFRQR